MANANGYDLPTAPRTPNVGAVGIQSPPPESGASSDRSGSGLRGTFQIPDNVRIEDLLQETLFNRTARMTLGTRQVPALGGIPLLSKLGEGGMGSVYLGYHPRLRKEVAVKVLHASPHDKTSIVRFCREAQLAAQVQSPHLVSVFDVNEEQSLFYIVMEFVQGCSAMDYMVNETDLRLKTTPQDSSVQPGIDEAIALRICIAACEGLATAHASEIVHRDIKPDNILIPRMKEDGRLDFDGAKLADLGLARSDRRGTKVTIAQFGMGTPGFMAPEQAMNAAKAGKPADVYALGSTLYALLAGRAPFTDGEPMQLVLATVQDEPAPVTHFRPDITAVTVQLLKRTLEKEPAKRAADARAMLVELRACLSGQSRPVESKRMEVPVRAANLPKRVVPAEKVDLQPAKPKNEGAPIIAEKAVENPAPKPVEPLKAISPEIISAPKPAAKPARSFLGSIGDSMAWGVRSLRYARLIARGKAAVKHKRWAEAIEAYKEAIPLDGDAKDSAARKGLEDAQFQQHLAEAQKAFERGDWDAALASYQTAQTVKPNDPTPVKAIERTHTQRTEHLFSSALREAEKELTGASKDGDGQFLDLRVSKQVKIEQIVKRALTIKPEDMRAMQLRTQLGETRTFALNLGNNVSLEILRCKPGEFEMGSGDGGAAERPTRKVKLSKLYYIGKYPVTVAQFRRFVEATNYVTEAERSGGWTLRSGRWMHFKGISWKQPGFSQADTHPVVLVSWADSLAFATWATRNASAEIPEKQHGLTVVLPTEAQWELSARSTKNLRYPWGQMWEGTRANHADLCLKNAGFGEFCSSENDGYCFTSPVGAMDNESWCGAYDLCGNVWQWCHDWYGDVYYRSAENTDPTGPAQGTMRSLRGGSWLDMPLKCRSFSRRGEMPEMAAANIGFRVAVTWTS